METSSSNLVLSVRKNCARWRELGLSASEERLIMRGVEMEWKDGPPRPFNMGVSKFAFEKEKWWSGERERLIAVGAIRRIEKARYVSRAFAVPKKGSNPFRLVIDLRHVNGHHVDVSCELEDLRSLRQLLSPGDYLLGMDLSDGYYHVGVSETAAKYFQFGIRDSHGIEYFEIPALNMGAVFSPGAFTDFLRPVVRQLRREGVRLLWYMDDFLLMGESAKEVRESRERFFYWADRLGLKVKTPRDEKPSQSIEHLGMLINSKRGTFGVTRRKLEKTKRLARALRCGAAENSRRVMKKDLAAFVGLAQYLAMAVPTAQFHLRALYNAMTRAEGWGPGVRVILRKEEFRDLRWWANLHLQKRTRPIWPPTTNDVLRTDASTYGWGATARDGELEARGLWSRREANMHITRLELRAVTKAIERFGVPMAGRYIRVFSDSTAAVAAINCGASKADELMRELRELFRLTDKGHITLCAEHIPGVENIRADELSRDQAWRSPPWAKKRAAQCTIDRFASFDNRVVPRYNSRWPEEEAEGLDGLAQDDECWVREVNYLYPPHELLPRVVEKLKRSGAGGVLVYSGRTSLALRAAIDDMALFSYANGRKRAAFDKSVAGMDPKKTLWLSIIPRRLKVDTRCVLQISEGQIGVSTWSVFGERE